MPVKIRNLKQDTFVLVELNSGETVRLSPGQSTGELHEAEVNENAKVAKLQAQRVIAVESTEGRAAKPGGTPAGGSTAGKPAEGTSGQPAAETTGEAGGDETEEHSRSKKRPGSAG